MNIRKKKTKFNDKIKTIFLRQCEIDFCLNEKMVGILIRIDITNNIS